MAAISDKNKQNPSLGPQKNSKIEPKMKEEDEHEKECSFMRENESCVKLQTLTKEIDSYKEMGIL